LRAGVSRELIETFILFGDPAMPLRFSAGHYRFMPQVVSAGGG